ncbi:MAG: LamG domain-containing protein, partial [Leptospiraceae bacterium]|nr:LamG domain-containing protein [Leptospiraceae bacterium]
EGYCITDDADSLDITTAITFMCWVKPRKMDTEQILFIKQNAFSLRITSGNALKAGIYISSSENTATTTQTVEFDKWKHVTAVYDGGTLDIYLDGVNVKSTNVTGTLDTNTNDMYTARNYDATLYLTGMIDEVKIYCKALTGAEVLEQYTTTEPDHSNASLPTGGWFIGDPGADQIIGDPGADEGIGNT